jgi:hypothetical protein
LRQDQVDWLEKESADGESRSAIIRAAIDAYARQIARPRVSHTRP